jgi:GTPase SAR1 family protein
VAEEPVHTFFIGTAGCGKTQLTRAYKRFLEERGLDPVLVNLDPGAGQLPYAPEVDIRDWVSLDKVMAEYGLGPNGAQVACADMIAMKLPEVEEVLEEFDPDVFLFDTPGQLELFVFRHSSTRIVERLGGAQPLLAYLYDPVLSSTPTGFVSLMMLGASTHFRFSVPMVNILSKADLLEPAQVETIEAWAEEPDRLMAALDEEGSQGAQKLLSVELLRAFDAMGAYRKLVPASADTLAGLEDLYTSAQLVYTGGEDLSPD